MKWLCLVILCGGCSSLPLSGSPEPLGWYVFPQPVCLILCTAHISAMREDAVAMNGTVTTGAKSNTSSSSSSQ